LSPSAWPLPACKSETVAAASERVRVRRGPHKGRYDRATIDAVLDRGLLCHVAFSDDDGAYCVPMLYARVGDIVYIHGSAASRALRALAGGAAACLTVTIVDGLVLARSAFEHSTNYESVMVFGRFTNVPDLGERLAALEAFTEKLLPGRWNEVRGPSTRELKATAILAMPITEASAKRRSGPPDDDDSPDAAIDTWAGVIPLVTSFGKPIPSPGLRPDIPLSASVRQLF
jgi:nitroimidazol reductase NimA-like FMN-containing flavoprotein (pyridoxamine 5'-phosphate oxidase superfamily)